MRIDEKDRELIHANDVLADQPWQLPSQQRLRLSPILPAEGCRPIAQVKEHLVLPPMALAQPAARPLHQHSLAIEVVPHEFFEPSNEECKLDLLAIHYAQPPIGDCHVVGIDHIVTQAVLSADQWANSGHRTFFREAIGRRGGIRRPTPELQVLLSLRSH